MTSNKLTRKEIENLLPHREPMLLIDELIDITNEILTLLDKKVKKIKF